MYIFIGTFFALYNIKLKIKIKQHVVIRIIHYKKDRYLFTQKKYLH